LIRKTPITGFSALPALKTGKAITQFGGGHGVTALP